MTGTAIFFYNEKAPQWRALFLFDADLVLQFTFFSLTCTEQPVGVKEKKNSLQSLNESLVKGVHYRVYRVLAVSFRRVKLVRPPGLIYIFYSFFYFLALQFFYINNFFISTFTRSLSVVKTDRLGFSSVQ